MVALATNTLPANYTASRPIRLMTAAAKASLTLEELAWVAREWRQFTGGPEDSAFNVIMERKTPITATRIWVMDRDGEDGAVIVMLPQDY